MVARVSVVGSAPVCAGYLPWFLFHVVITEYIRKKGKKTYHKTQFEKKTFKINTHTRSKHKKKTKTTNNTFFLGGGGDETLRKAHTQKHTHTRNPFSVGFCCLFVCFLMLRDEKGLEIRKRRQHSESFPISSNSIRACVCPLSVCASL